MASPSTAAASVSNPSPSSSVAVPSASAVAPGKSASPVLLATWAGDRYANVNLDAGTVSATVGSGVTVVTYTNKVTPIPQLGFIEVCKTAADPYVTGNFDFTITAPAFSTTRSVLVGQCSEPIQVPVLPGGGERQRLALRNPLGPDGRKPWLTCTA